MTTDIFYDRSTRVWIGMVKDEQGNQVGDAEIAYTKQAVVDALRERVGVAA